MINQPNYTQCPNIFFDEILKNISGSEVKVFCVIMRKTFGWQKTRDRISYSQIMDMAGIASKATVSEAIKSLETKGYIIAEKEKQITVYSINVSEVEPVQKLNQYDNCTSTGTEIEPSQPKTGTKTVHTKENNINKLSKEIYIEIEAAYSKTYKEIFGVEPSLIMFSAFRKREKVLLESGLSKEIIISAIKQARNDAWIVEKGFDFMMILSDRIITRLVNESGKNVINNPCVSNIDFNVECCGQKISRYRPFCIKCGKQFNMDGTEK